MQSEDASKIYRGTSRESIVGRDEDGLRDSFWLLESWWYGFVGRFLAGHSTRESDEWGGKKSEDKKEIFVVGWIRRN